MNKYTSYILVFLNITTSNSPQTPLIQNYSVIPNYGDLGNFWDLMKLATKKD